ncbi:MAG: hypothetical protein KC431_30900, partial [Myxococcales bacterium]|nr:hypothetical protein [Myxococcales bacterium]
TDSSDSTDTGVEPDPDALLEGLEDAACTDYVGDGDGGLAHVSYWGILAGSPEFDALPAAEQAKLQALQGTQLHSLAIPPSGEIPGRECTGALQVEDQDGLRRQEIIVKLPSDWNGRLVVLGTPGTRDEWSTEGVFAPWLLAQGYATVVGNKGMTNDGADGNQSMLAGTHPTRHWGLMMLDMADWARPRLELAAAAPVERVYAAGISNGGYQVRRALELDALAVEGGDDRRFDGGLDWEGAYWPDAAVLDQNDDAEVSVAELAGYEPFWLTSNERAAVVMGWAHDPGSLTNPVDFATDPPFAPAHPEMLAVGFDADSAPIWGAYNATFDYLAGLGYTAFKGTGYYNITAQVFRAELLGDDAMSSAAYSPYSDGSDNPPPFYAWLAMQVDGGWTDEAVAAALDNANSGAFTAPMISVHGQADALLGVHGNAYAYAEAVADAGDPSLHRLYVVEHAGHIDRHADGLLDFDFDGENGEEGMADRLTYLQPYVEASFALLVAWVEAGTEPPASKTVATDPTADVLSADQAQI